MMANLCIVLQSLSLICILELAAAARVEVGVESWRLESRGPWGAREGLMAASLGDSMYLTGGRGTYGVGFARDVWRSSNGTEWTIVTDSAPWDRRAYHIVIPMGGCLYLAGGQTFLTFYNDVWKTCDGSTWELLTKEANWSARAGLGGTEHNGELVIAGGCYQDGLKRSFLGDVWSSEDGKSWKQLTSDAPWKARSGLRLVSFKEELYVIAGEVGFTPDTQLGDIWRSADGGVSWKLVTASPGFSPRSGHGVVVHPSGSALILVAGWPELHDMWMSANGTSWVEVSKTVWQCSGSGRNDTCGKFDFWMLVHQNKLFTVGGSGSYSTFGKMYDETWSFYL